MIKLLKAYQSKLLFGVYTLLGLTGCSGGLESTINNHLNPTIPESKVVYSDSLNYILELPDSALVSIEIVETLEAQFIQSSVIATNADSILMIQKKLNNFWANNYKNIVETQLNTLSDLGFDYNDYLNKLDFIDNTIYTAFNKFPNTKAGLELKDMHQGFKNYKNKCIENRTILAKFLAIIISPTIKTAAEIDILKTFDLPATENPFREKVEYHINTYNLHQAVNKYLRAKARTIYVLNKNIATLKKQVKYQPVNDSLLNVAVNLSENTNALRRKTLDYELMDKLPMVERRLESWVAQNCNNLTQCSVKIQEIFPPITKENMRVSQVFTIRFNYLNSNEICENTSLQECRFTLNASASIHSGYSFSFTSILD